MHDTQSIKSALERAVKVVRLQPARGQRVYRNVASVGDGIACQVEEAGRSLCLDVGKAVGGDDSAPNPSMLLRSALSGCVAIGIKQWAARRDVQIDYVEVVLETDVDARGQLGVRDDVTPGFQEVRMMITVTSPASREDVEDVVSVSLRYSPLFDVFQYPQPVVHQVQLVGSSAGAQRSELS